MHPRVQAELGRHGLICRRTALKVGMSGPEIDRLVRVGEWVTVWRGTYVPAEVWHELDDYVGKPLRRARAASAHMLSPHVMSHDSAALELGIAVLDAPAQPVHVTRFGVVGSRHRHGVKHHKAPFTPEQLVELENGRMALDAARTVADIARDRGFEAGLVAADSAMNHGVTRAQLSAAVEAMECWPYVRVVRRVVSLADPGADSAGETLTRVLLMELGHSPQTQFGLTDGRRLAWCDLRVGRHVIEFDGRLKYGVRDGADTRRLWEEKQRQDFIQGHRLGVSRVVWADLHAARRAQTRSRLDREIRATQELFGSDIADLAPFRPAGPRPSRVL